MNYEPTLLDMMQSPKAASSVQISKQDWVVGAIYKLTLKRGRDRTLAAELLQTRAGFTEAKAVQLAGHWFRYGKDIEK